MAEPAIDAFKQNQVPLSKDVFKQANNDWWAAAIQLVPILHRKDLLNYVSNKDGLTKFNTNLSKASGLKGNTIPVIVNNLKKVMEFREAFRNIDLQKAKMYNLTQLFQQAKKMDNNNKLTLGNVKKVVNSMLQDGALEKSDIDYVEDIESQEQIADRIKLDDAAQDESKKPAKGASTKTVKVSTTTKKAQSDTSKADAKKKEEELEAKRAAAAQKRKETMAKKKQDAEAKKLKDAEPNEQSVALAKKQKHDETKQLSNAEAKQMDDEAAKQLAVAESDSSKSQPTMSVSAQYFDADTDPVTKELVSAYLDATDIQKDAIMDVATAMQGDQNIALLKSLDTTSASALLKMMSLMR
ncbi:hypothetical protein [Alteromonas macleodii]|uniref:hypothetical protein n=1 Tax=Alteromonas macleodii TaxID=28108 RepID=UPI00314054C4